MRAFVVSLLLVAACSQRLPPPQRTPPAQRDRVPPADTLAPRPRTPSVNLTQAGNRDSLRAEILREREAWRAVSVADYEILVQSECFCPRTGGWHTLEVRGGATRRVRDGEGRVIPLGEWAAYSVDSLFVMVERSVERVDAMGVRWDPQWHFPAFITMDYRLGLPDDWAMIEVRGFRRIGG